MLSLLLLSAVALVFGIDRDFVETLYQDHQDAPAELVWRGALAMFLSAALVWLATLLWQESGASSWVATTLRLNSRHQRPTAWDFWFRKKYKTHVRIRYADGQTVWGYYGPESFASYAKEGRDLYLEYVFPEATGPDAERHLVGDWDPRSRGVWVRVDEAVAVSSTILTVSKTPKTGKRPLGPKHGGQGPPVKRPPTPPSPIAAQGEQVSARSRDGQAQAHPTAPAATRRHPRASEACPPTARPITSAEDA